MRCCACRVGGRDGRGGHLLQQVQRALATATQLLAVHARTCSRAMPAKAGHTACRPGKTAASQPRGGHQHAHVGVVRHRLLAERLLDLRLGGARLQAQHSIRIHGWLIGSGLGGESSGSGGGGGSSARPPRCHCRWGRGRNLMIGTLIIGFPVLLASCSAPRGPSGAAGVCSSCSGPGQQAGRC